MTVKGEGAASPPFWRPEVRRPTPDAQPFIFAANIPAAGFRCSRRSRRSRRGRVEVLR